MRIIIELYDKEPVENVLSACIFRPDMVVYLCDGKDTTLRREQAVSRLLKSHKLKTKTRFYYADTRSVGLIQKLLDAVVRDYPGCVFDFSGGTDLMLITAAVYCAQHKLPAFYIDMNRGRFVNLRGCERLAFGFAMPSFTAEDIFAISGTRLVGNGHFPLAMLTADFSVDARRIWQEVLKNPEQWNAAAGFFQAVGARLEANELRVSTTREVRINKSSIRCGNEPLAFLEQVGILQDLQQEKNKISFRYKNNMMKKSLQNHGLWLELHVYLEARDSGLFDDTRTSVVVEWDADVKKDTHTRNEIDVLLLRGITPIFVSCKMGAPTPLALSEIKILSEKLGGARAKTAIVSAAPVRAQSPGIARRAEDLDIFLLDREDLRKGGVAQRLARLVSG